MRDLGDGEGDGLDIGRGVPGLDVKVDEASVELGRHALGQQRLMETVGPGRRREVQAEAIRGLEIDLEIRHFARGGPEPGGAPSNLGAREQRDAGRGRPAWLTDRRPAGQRELSERRPAPHASLQSPRGSTR